MDRYFQLKDAQTLEVYLSMPLAKQPPNSVKFTPNNFAKTVFDKYPNPTKVIEGQTDEEREAVNNDLIAELDAEYTAKIDELVRIPMQKAFATNSPLPKDITDKREGLITKFHQKVFEITGITPKDKLRNTTFKK